MKIIALLLIGLLNRCTGLTNPAAHRSVKVVSSLFSTVSTAYSEDFHYLNDLAAPAPKPRTHYEILGAAPTATQRELKQLYVALARVTHPDASGRDTGAEFSQVSQAYKVLSDTKERRRYDRHLVAQDFTKSVEFVADGLVSTIANVCIPQLKRVFEHTMRPLMHQTHDSVARHEASILSTVTVVVLSCMSLGIFPLLTNLSNRL